MHTAANQVQRIGSFQTTEWAIVVSALHKVVRETFLWERSSLNNGFRMFGAVTIGDMLS